MSKNGITICNTLIKPGKIHDFYHDITNLFTHSVLKIPIRVHCGKKEGPRVFILSTVHGNELNGIEILNRLHHHPAIKQIKGILITVPVVNAYGLLLKQRHVLTKDLNRSFPGSCRGSFASQLAHFCLEEIIRKCEYGMDLHSGGSHLFNLPQIRIDIETPGAKEFAMSTGLPVINTKIRPKSLRKLAQDLKIPLLVYEGGETGRLNKKSIENGLQAVLNSLVFLGMIDKRWRKPIENSTNNDLFFSKGMRWIRSPSSGLLIRKKIKRSIKEGQELAEVKDPLNISSPYQLVKSPFNGFLIARTTSALINEGEPLFHLATKKK